MKQTIQLSDREWEYFRSRTCKVGMLIIPQKFKDWCCSNTLSMPNEMRELFCEFDDAADNLTWNIRPVESFKRMNELTEEMVRTIRMYGDEEYLRS